MVHSNLSVKQQKIREAKDKMKKLKDQKERQDIQTLYSAIQGSGKSVEDLLQLLKDQQDPDESKTV